MRCALGMPKQEKKGSSIHDGKSESERPDMNVENVWEKQVPSFLMGISSKNYSTPNPFSMGLHLVRNNAFFSSTLPTSSRKVSFTRSERGSETPAWPEYS